MCHLRSVDSSGCQFSKTSTYRLVRETIGERIGFRQVRGDQKAALDLRHRRVVANDLAVVQQGSEGALHLVEQILILLGGLDRPCCETGVERCPSF